MSDADFFRKLDDLPEENPVNVEELKKRDDFFEGQTGPFGGAMYTDEKTGKTHEYFFLKETGQIGAVNWDNPVGVQNTIRIINGGSVPREELRKPTAEEFQRYLER